ncbi:MAG: hypothetical protein IPJ65_25790 [Archangiaceae bacterium]|nr:hypothetical protein [Archangiaceae bacterium]
MSHEELPPLDSDISALLRSARAPSPSAELRARAFERIAASAARGATAAAGGAVAGAAAQAGVVKLGVLALPLAAAALAVGALGGYQLGARRAVAPPPPIVITLAAATVPEPRREPEPRAAPAEPSPVKPAGSLAEPRRDLKLADERALIELARSALARRDPATGLAALERHRQGYADGKLAEEREALVVQALIDSGRRADALERAQQFKARFPSSLLLPAIDEMLAE